MSPFYMIECYTASRPRATLIAFLIDAEERLTDTTINALADTIETDSDPIDTINASVGWANLLRARHWAAEIADTADWDPL